MIGVCVCVEAMHDNNSQRGCIGKQILGAAHFSDAAALSQHLRLMVITTIFPFTCWKQLGREGEG